MEVRQFRAVAAFKHNPIQAVLFITDSSKHYRYSVSVDRRQIVLWRRALTLIFLVERLNRIAARLTIILSIEASKPHSSSSIGKREQLIQK